MSSGSSSDSDVYQDASTKRKVKRGKKRRKTGSRTAISVIPPKPQLSFSPLMAQLESYRLEDDEFPFEETMDSLLPEYLQTRSDLQGSRILHSADGQILRPLTRYEASSLLQDVEHNVATIPQLIALRKLKLLPERRKARLKEDIIQSPSGSITPLSVPQSSSLSAKPEVIEALHSIRTTPHESSFYARLYGHGSRRAELIAVDFETISPWMDLMSDIRAHYALAHPKKEVSCTFPSPITYTWLHDYHLEQVHDLLARSFWPDIDVSDSLQYSPERCTVVVMYNCIVIGVAIMSSPRETYITYLAVKAGWDNVQVATSMLYHLITRNPNTDITLHVSVNNPAMLLYNQFGFKAEEFVAGFYEDYLDPQSRASKNAFRLRLRR